MAATIDFSLIREPHLLDLIDEEWAAERLPDDGEAAPGTCRSAAAYAYAPAAAAANRVPAACLPASQTSHCPPPSSCCQTWRRSRRRRSRRSGTSWGCSRWADRAR